jgi:hypothetical protein
MFKEFLSQLSVPFPSGLIEWKPQATTPDKKRALAAAYVDLREYEDRLDQVYPEWSSSVQFMVSGDKVAAVVSLTLDGVTRVNVGEANLSDENAYTSAYAQGFKRACSSFGLGRYLYRLPQVWCDYDEKRRAIIGAPEVPGWARHPDELAMDAALASRPTVKPDPKEEVDENPAPAPAKPAPTPEPVATISNPAGYVMPAGKYQGKTLAEIFGSKEGQDYLRWFANLDGKGYQARNGSVEAQRMVRAFLAVNAAYAG